jgi:hypothetical protein
LVATSIGGAAKSGLSQLFRYFIKNSLACGRGLSANGVLVVAAPEPRLIPSQIPAIAIQKRFHQFFSSVAALD